MDMIKPEWLNHNRIPLKAHARYLWYVLRHKWFVLVAWWRLWRAGLSHPGTLRLVLVHDLSKFRPSEWWPYVVNFYTDAQSEEYRVLCARWGIVEMTPHGGSVGDHFRRAWLHHQNRNPHHWQYWMYQEDDGPQWRQQMPQRYIVEMVCDWMGAGRAITGKWEMAKWFSKSSHKIKLNDATRERVVSLVELCP